MTKRRDNGAGSVTRREGHPGSPWQARFYVDGRRRAVYATTKADALDKMRREQRRAAEGLKPTQERLTLAAFLEAWLARDRDVRAVTAARYRTLLEGHVVPVIGTRKLVELQPDDVRRVLDRMKLAGLSPTTRSHVRAALRLALGDAVRDGLVSRNVASREYVTLATPKPRRVAAMSASEMRAVLAAVDGDRLTPLYRFITATGCRMGEALGLRWRDVRWERAEVEFVQTLGRLAGADIFSDPKNEASRGIFPMTPPVRAALLDQKRMQDAGLTGAPAQLLVDDGGIARGPLCFTATDGGPLSASFVTHRFQTLLERAGIERMTVHALRHLFVSNLFAEGVPIELISGLVRHASPQVTRTIYLHLRSDRKAEAAAKINHLFETGS